MALSVAGAKRARIALQRFGLGPRPGALERIGDDPRGALKAELEQADVALIDASDLPSKRVALRDSQNGYAAAEANRRKELDARIAKHLSVEIGFVERLVLFWSNHFSMSINKDDVIRGSYGQLEREVIRANVLGDFTAMLRGVIQHPAMLRYLDNQDSIGPHSKRGKEWRRGLNENLGRELLELHTLGAGGGYSETDVTSMAKALTGWSYVNGWQADSSWEGGAPSIRGQFIFRRDWHEPGPITILGKTYRNDGVKRGQRVLIDLARKRATAEHLAFKLVRHFITDQPTPAMVDPVADAFRKTGGDLKATALALIALPEAWNEPMRKIRTPYELAIAQFRAMRTSYVDENRWAFTEPLRALNDLPWERPAPDGYPDESYAWLDPDGMTIRLDTAMLVVDRFGEGVRQPLKLARSLYGAALSEDLADALTWIPDTRSALTLLFMSPEFQRR
ncbi:DUF1800 domain-containing protein [Hansschlegelia sp. KR7-227]|uniref:DUF1800 domain-containing protein n=1 Tax=Hansschlegelia sp. KR7-227 TaxID=3400914 RepID=UPI003C1218A4